MEIKLTPDQQDFIENCVASERCSSAEDAVQNAVAVWIEIERDRSELIALLQEGEADIAAGRYTEYDEDGLRELCDQIKREGRQRLARVAS
jgi:Arc/MetJ-type ribon-helix-helix transcriptional regulator